MVQVKENERNITETYQPNKDFAEIKTIGSIEKKYLNNNTKELFCILNVLSGSLKRYKAHDGVALSNDLLKSLRTANTYISKLLHYLSSDGIDIDFHNKNRSANKLNRKLFMAEIYARDIGIQEEEYKEFVDLRVAYLTVKDLFEKVPFEKQTTTFCKYILTHINKFYEDIER